MKNLRMCEKLNLGECIDVRQIGREIQPGFFELESYTDDVDYCDAKTEQWIWSIGRRIEDGVIVASLDTSLYMNPQYVCLWLR